MPMRAMSDGATTIRISPASCTNGAIPRWNQPRSRGLGMGSSMVVPLLDTP